MKHSLFLTILAAALLGSGVANAAGTLKASDYKGGSGIILGSAKTYDTLAVNVPLTMTGWSGYLDLYNGATLAFQKKQAADEICSIISSADTPVYFENPGDVYNFTFDADAQAIVAASAGTPITLIKDPNEGSLGFGFYHGSSPSNTILTLNGAEAGDTVVLDGVSFTYVGPQSSDYTFLKGEIGFTGYENGSHALNLVVGNATPTPEPTTGTLSLLALAGLCARRRRK